MGIEYKTLVVEFVDGRRKENEETLKTKFGCKIIDSGQLRGYVILVPEDKVKELKEYKKIGNVEDFNYTSTKKSIQ